MTAKPNPVQPPRPGHVRPAQHQPAPGRETRPIHTPPHDLFPCRITR